MHEDEVTNDIESLHLHGLAELPIITARSLLSTNSRRDSVTTTSSLSGVSELNTFRQVTPRIGSAGSVEDGRITEEEEYNETQHEMEAKEFSSIESILRRAPFFNPILVPEMEHINLSFNQLPNIPDDIASFKKLRILVLSHNSIRTFNTIYLVESCPLLEKIDLSYNRINNIRQFLELGHLQRLEEVDFRMNPIPILENRIAIIQALLFYHPFKPMFPSPAESRNRTPFLEKIAGGR
jgi:Leucine-rich repeat (LRR) protein